MNTLSRVLCITAVSLSVTLSSSAVARTPNPTAEPCTANRRSGVEGAVAQLRVQRLRDGVFVQRAARQGQRDSAEPRRARHVAHPFGRLHGHGDPRTHGDHARIARRSDTGEHRGAHDVRQQAGAGCTHAQRATRQRRRRAPLPCDVEDRFDVARSAAQDRPERLRASRATAPRRAPAHVDPCRVRPAALLGRIRQHRPAAAASGRARRATGAASRLRPTACALPRRSRPGTPPGRTASRRECAARRASSAGCDRGNPGCPSRRSGRPCPR